MSSTPLLERTIDTDHVEWVEIVSPNSNQDRTIKNGAGIVIALAELRESINGGSAPTLILDTDDFREIDADDIAAAQHAADRWDS